jgi:pyruvate dehydrogenase E2 component (dihydrolipoamide acetyltransferase)
MSVTLSCDHRAVDGAHAAEFLRDLKWVLENPAALAL